MVSLWTSLHFKACLMSCRWLIITFFVDLRHNSQMTKWNHLYKVLSIMPAKSEYTINLSCHYVWLISSSLYCYLLVNILKYMKYYENLSTLDSSKFFCCFPSVSLFTLKKLVSLLLVLFFKISAYPWPCLCLPLFFSSFTSSAPFLLYLNVLFFKYILKYTLYT